jgi:hypothetical protein
LLCPDPGIRIAFAHKGSKVRDVSVFTDYVGAVLGHPHTLLLSSQFARKPSRHRASLYRVGRQQPCLGAVTLTAPENTSLEAVKRLLNTDCQHPHLAGGAPRALDRKEFWIGLSHGRLAEDQTIISKKYDARTVVSVWHQTEIFKIFFGRAEP